MKKAASIDVGALIEGQRFGRFQIGLMFWICTFMLIEGYDMQVVGYAAPAIIKAWHSDKAAFGVVFGAGLGDLLLVAAGDDVLVVERDRAGVSVEVPDNLDPTRRSGRVRLHNVSVTAADVLPGARESALARARTLLAAEAVGGAADCVDAAVE